MSNIESDTKPTTEERHHPLLKMALEIGPLMVFFFGNLRGEWLAKTFPALTAVGGPLLIATAAPLSIPTRTRVCSDAP